MAQFARPTSDLDNTGVWTTTPLWSKIDETPGSEDSTFAVSDANPTSTEPFTVDMSTVSDPSDSTGHVIRARWSKQNDTGANHAGRIELRQGYTNEGSQGTLIATLTGAALANTLTTQSYTLSGGEADSITDYSDLQFRIYAEKTGGGAGDNWHIEWVEFECPDAGAAEQTLTGAAAFTPTLTFPTGDVGAAGSLTGTAAFTPTLSFPTGDVNNNPGGLPNAAVIAIYDARHVAGSVSDPVENWSDEGPKSQDPLTQATSGSRPLINESGFDGVRALLFDGSDDFMTVTLDQSYTGDYALILVMELVSWADSTIGVYSTGSVPNKTILGVDADDDAWVVMSGDGTQAEHHQGTNNATYLFDTPSRFVMTQFVENDNRLRLYENGVIAIDQAPASAGDLNNMGALTLGARESQDRNANIRVGYLVLVDMAQTDLTTLLAADTELMEWFNVTAAANLVGGAAFAPTLSFPQGSVDPGTVTLTGGAAFTPTLSFPQGDVGASNTLTGAAAFTPTLSFPQGSVDPSNTLTGSLFTPTLAFPQGSIANDSGPQSVTGSAAFQPTLSFPQGSVDASNTLTGGAAFTPTLSFPQGSVDASNSLTGAAAFAPTLTFPQGDVSSAVSLTGSVFQPGLVFPQGAVSSDGAPQTVTGGAAFTPGLVFPQGSVDPGTVTVTGGTVFTPTLVFPTGSIGSGTTLAGGAAFAPTLTFPQGSLTSVYTLAGGAAFAPTLAFPQGSVTPGAVTITGSAAFTPGLTFPQGTLAAGSITFWELDPVGFTSNPVGHTSDPVGFVKVGPDDNPPW